MSDKAELWWIDSRGKTTVDVNLVADARNVAGLAGYPWIIIAANPQLSNMAVERYLAGCGIDGAERSLSWIQRRRWMFRTVKPGNANGPTPDLDRNQARAIKIMREHPKFSNMKLVHVLKERGIKRSREWVRQHRCDPVV